MENKSITLHSHSSNCESNQSMPEQRVLEVSHATMRPLFIIQDNTAQIISLDHDISLLDIGLPSAEFKLENVEPARCVDLLPSNESSPNHIQKKRKRAAAEPKKKAVKPSLKEEVVFPKKVWSDSYRKQFFSRKWLENPEFTDWLRETISPDKGFCRYCKSELTAGKSELQRHSQSARHIRNAIEHVDFPRGQSPDKECNFHSFEEKSVERTETSSINKTRIIDYRSDSLSIPSYAMRKAMVEAQTGDTSFGTDKTVKDFETSVAAMLKKERGLFFPTNTMANLVAVLAHCRSRGSAVFVGDKSDVHINNEKSLVRFGGLYWCTLQNYPDGSFSLEELEERLKNVDKSLQYLICYESTNVTFGGVVTPIEWLDQLHYLCRNYNALLHCDGTRLANASVYMKTPLYALVESCDSVTFGLDKGLGAPFGAVLAGETNFIKRCEYLRNSLGGQIHQAGLFAAAGKFALEMMPSIDVDHQKARKLARAVSLERSKQIGVVLEDLHTNIVHLHCLQQQVTAEDLCRRLSQVNPDLADDVPILCEVVDDETVAFRVHRQISERDLNLTLAKLRRIIQEIKLPKPKKFRKARRKLDAVDPNIEHVDVYNIISI